MPVLSISTTYADDDTLFKSQLDEIKDGIESFLNTTKIDQANIQTGGVDSNSIATSAVTEAKLAAASVSTAKIQDLAVTGGKLDSTCADGSTLELASSHLRVKDAGVTWIKRATRAVTEDGTDPGLGGISKSNLCTTFSRSTNSFAAVTNLSCTLTTGGGPVFIGLQSSFTAGTNSNVDVAITSAGTGQVGFFRDSSQISASIVGGSVDFPASIFFNIDTDAAAGTHTYTAKAAGDGTHSIVLQNLRLIAYEL